MMKFCCLNMYKVGKCKMCGYERELPHSSYINDIREDEFEKEARERGFCAVGCWNTYLENDDMWL